MIVLLFAYTCGHDRACVRIYAWHDRAYVCICAQARSRLCVHTRVGMISPMRAYMRDIIMPVFACTGRHDHTYVCIYTWV
jgi:hypothetical protein